MEDVADLSCPYCGETLSWYFEQEIEGVLVQDCDVCCRPIQVELSRNWDGDLIVRTTRAQ